MDFQQLDLEARRSAQRVYMRSSIVRPVLAFGAAGAGMDFEIGVVGVRFAGKQRLDLPALDLGMRRGSPLPPRRRSPSSPSSSPISISSMLSASACCRAAATA